MVDVKLDVGNSPSLKAAFKKNSGTGICGVLMYLLLIGSVTVLALDAAEFISLGIVKNVMGLKVMKAEEFTKMTDAYRTQLAEKDQQFNALTAERDGIRSQVTQLMEEKTNLSQADNDKQNQINAVTGERDSATGERDTLKKQLEDLTVEIFNLKKQIDEATQTNKTTAEMTDKA